MLAESVIVCVCLSDLYYSIIFLSGWWCSVLMLTIFECIFIAMPLLLLDLSSIYPSLNSILSSLHSTQGISVWTYCTTVPLWEQIVILTYYILYLAF